MSEKLTKEQKLEINALAIKFAVNRVRAKLLWEDREKLSEKEMTELVAKWKENDEEDEEEEPEEVEETKPIDQRQRILDKIEESLDAEKKSDWVKLIESSPDLKQMVGSFVSVLMSFTEKRYEQVEKIICSITRNGDKIDVKYSVFNKDNSKTMFDSDGNPIEILKSEK